MPKIRSARQFPGQRMVVVESLQLTPSLKVRKRRIFAGDFQVKSSQPDNLRSQLSVQRLVGDDIHSGFQIKRLWEDIELHNEARKFAVD